MEITTIHLTIGGLFAIIANVIKVTTKWNQQDNKFQNLEHRIVENEINDKE